MNFIRLLVVCVGSLLFIWSVSAGAEKTDKKDKDKAKDEGGGQIVMNIIEIKGKIDQPQAVYIINLAKPDLKGIKLEKDFTQSIKNEDFKGLENLKVDENLPPEALEIRK